MKNSTRMAALVAGLLFTASASMAQVTAVGVIGPGSPGGTWDFSNGVNALSQTTSTSHVWIGTKTMSAGEFKFRTNNDWATNWGAPATGTAFPNTAGAPGALNGGNITATAGRYFVTINDQTGAYTFTAVTATATRAASAALGLSLTPNPAAEVTRIAYELPAAADVTLTLVNQLGQTVRQLPTLRQGAGSQEQYLVRQDLAAGLYMVKLQAGDQHQALRLLVN